MIIKDSQLNTHQLVSSLIEIDPFYKKKFQGNKEEITYYVGMYLSQ